MPESDSMPSRKNQHPLTRVRMAYADYGQKDMATTAGFARRLGCSVSLVRNVESGIFPLSKKLAARIQEVAGISAEWLEGNPGKDDPIMDVEGNPWTPDYGNNFSLVPNMVNLAKILYLQIPEYLPIFVGAALESLLSVKPPSMDILSDLETVDQKGFLEMYRYVDTFIEPAMRLIDNLDPAQHPEFLNAMKKHLGGHHAVEADQLLVFWDHVTIWKDSRPVLRGDIRFLPTPKQRRALHNTSAGLAASANAQSAQTKDSCTESPDQIS